MTTKSNILLLFMEKRKNLFAMYAVVPLASSLNWLSIFKTIIKVENMSVKIVEKSLLDLEVWPNTSKQFMEHKKVTDVIRLQQAESLSSKEIPESLVGQRRKWNLLACKKSSHFMTLLSRKPTYPDQLLWLWHMLSVDNDIQ